MTMRQFSQFKQLLDLVKNSSRSRRVIINTNCIELESLMLYAKFQDHRKAGAGEEDF